MRGVSHASSPRSELRTYHVITPPSTPHDPAPQNLPMRSAPLRGRHPSSGRLACRAAHTSPVRGGAHSPGFPHHRAGKPRCGRCRRCDLAHVAVHLDRSPRPPRDPRERDVLPAVLVHLIVLDRATAAAEQLHTRVLVVADRVAPHLDRAAVGMDPGAGVALEAALLDARLVGGVGVGGVRWVG